MAASIGWMFSPMLAEDRQKIEKPQKNILVQLNAKLRIIEHRGVQQTYKKCNTQSLFMVRNKT